MSKLPWVVSKRALKLAGAFSLVHISLNNFGLQAEIVK
jgi:hypothetical protein